MAMKAYKSYKNVDLPWLKRVPEHWEVARNKNFLSEQKAIVGDNFANYSLLSLTLNGVIIRDVNNGKGKFPASFNTYKIVSPGNMVFCLFDIDETPRTVGLSTHYGMITNAYEVLGVHNITPQYLYYYYLQLDNRKALKPLYHGLRKTIPIGTFLQTKLPVPPKKEQDQIVRYLDWQNSRLNKLINAKKKEIALLEEQKQALISQAVTKGLDPHSPLKDSGIDYIGYIPKHWRVLQNRRLYSSVSRKYSDKQLVLSLSQKDGLIPYENMSERSLHTSSYDNWKLVLENDLVLNRFKAHLGVFFASDYNGIVTFHYGVYEPKFPIISKFYEALYHTESYKCAYAGQSRGMTVGLQNLSDTDFYSIYTVYPPYKEQIKISNYIKRLEYSFSKYREQLTQYISLLQEYRTRLVADVVTGQIDVRHITIPNYETVPETIDQPETTEDDSTISAEDQ